MWRMDAQQLDTGRTDPEQSDSEQTDSEQTDAEQFRLLAEDALNQLPARFRMAMENVVIITDEFAETEVLNQMQVSSPGHLLGLYEGRPITERDSGDTNALPDVIHLYRQPILSMCRANGESTEQCVREVLIHEIGHYFGFSDADMERIESAAEQHRRAAV